MKDILIYSLKMQASCSGKCITLNKSKTVINTSSNSLLFVKHFDYSTLDKLTKFKKLFGPYSASKLALSLRTQEIAPAALWRTLRFAVPV